MSKTMTLFVALFVVIAAFLMLRYFKSDFGITPSTKGKPEAIANQDFLDFHEWREFSFKPEHFKVLLPGTPQHVSENIKDPKTKKLRKYETYATASNNGVAFMVNAISFAIPEEVEINDETLKSVVNEILARNRENKLNEMKSSTFKGAPALDFSYNNENLLIEGKVFAHENTIYILSMIDKKVAFMKKELDFFINSFDFVDDKPKATSLKRGSNE